MNNYISKIQIDAFRGIKGLRIDDLGTINVIAGANNSGKTSLLEAIKCSVEPGNLSQFLRLLKSRTNSNNADKVEVAKSFFSKTDAQELIIETSIVLDTSIRDLEVRAVEEKRIGVSGVERRVLVCDSLFGERLGNGGIDEKKRWNISNTTTNTKVDKVGLRESCYIYSGGNYYDLCLYYLKGVIFQMKKGRLLELLKSFDKSVSGVEVIDNNIYIADKENELRPLYSYGMGLQKTVLIASLLLAKPGSIVMFDEIDNAINIAVFKEVFPWFVQTCRDLEIQAFITTHSAEAIDAILNSIDDISEDDIRMITLRIGPKTGRTIAKVRTGRDARNSRTEFDAELRV